MIKTSAKIFLAALLFTGIWGCGGGREEEPAGPAPASGEAKKAKRPAIDDSDPVQLFIASIDAYNGQDLAAYMPLFSPSMEWIFRTSAGNTIKGPAETARFLMRERKAFPDCQIQLQRILAQGDELVVQGVFEGTHQGAIGRVPPTGKKVGYEFVYDITTESGKIRKNIIYVNVITMFRQMGVISSKKIAMPSYPEKPEIIKGASNADNEAAAKRFLSLWEAGSYADLTALLGPKFQLNNRALMESLKADKELKDYLEGERKAYQGLAFEVKELKSVGPYVSLNAVKKGTYQISPMGSTTPLTKELAIDQALIFRFEGGKIESADLYYDEMQLYKQFGFNIRQTVMLLGDNLPLAGPQAAMAPDAGAGAKPAEPPKAPAPKASAAKPKKP